MSKNDITNVASLIFVTLLTLLVAVTSLSFNFTTFDTIGVTGRAVYNEPLRLWDEAFGEVTDFATHFSFETNNSGDGLTFFLAHPDLPLPRRGFGAGLGLVDTFDNNTVKYPFVAVEFDTRQTLEFGDPPYKHAGINVNSMNSSNYTAWSDDILDREANDVWVTYDSFSTILRVVFSGYDNDTREIYVRDLEHRVDVKTVLPEYVIFGFSTARENYLGAHTLKSWSFSSVLTAEDEPPPPRTQPEARKLKSRSLIPTLMVGAGTTPFGFSLDMYFPPPPDPFALAPADEPTPPPPDTYPPPPDTYPPPPDAFAPAPEYEPTPPPPDTYPPPPVDEPTPPPPDTYPPPPPPDPVTSAPPTPAPDVHDYPPPPPLVLTPAVPPPPCHDDPHRPRPKRITKKLWLNLVLPIAGSLLSVVVLGFSYYKIKNKKRNVEDGGFGGRGTDEEFKIGSGPKEFSYEDLLRATNKFAEKEKLGQGGFGGVYRGYLEELESLVAVKRMSKGSKQGFKEYASEVNIISRLRHKNLVQLIGWCHEKRGLLLVYELMSNGSLDFHLFGGRRPLLWDQRYKIARDLASALLYLHEECEQCVLHRDIKSSNVMLDEDFNAKLGDFGLAKLVDHDKGSHAPARVSGTRGYLAPELCTRFVCASKETDVYSFGVVLLELASGRKPEDGKLVKWVWGLYGTGRLLEASDQKLDGKFDKGQMQRLMFVGLSCAHPDYTARLSIKKAARALNDESPLPPPSLIQNPKPSLVGAMEVSYVESSLPPFPVQMPVRHPTGATEVPDVEYSLPPLPAQMPVPNPARTTEVSDVEYSLPPLHAVMPACNPVGPDKMPPTSNNSSDSGSGYRSWESRNTSGPSNFTSSSSDFTSSSSPLPFLLSLPE